MDYTSLTGGKTTPGSIMNWVSYTKLDITTVVEEAQSLLFQMLRCREMRSTWTFAMGIGQVSQPLPPRFLDPVGDIFDLTNWTGYRQLIESRIEQRRNYDPSLAGSFGADPFTTALNSSSVNALLAAHGLNQGSTITIAGASTVNGLTMNGASPVTAVVDANNITIDVNDLNNDVLASAAGSGGGAAATYTANNLISGGQSCWTVFNEKVEFDAAFDVAATCNLLIFRRPRLLSAINPTNFVTSRYPTLMRVACLAAAAKYMKDDTEYAKQVKDLSDLIGATAAENDLIYRGAEFGTDTP